MVIGITGGLATGKTTIVDMFVEKGAVKIDADEISHRLLEKDADIQSKVAKLFGKEMLNGETINRKKLGGTVFFDKDKLDKLSNILHPEIIRCIRDEIKHYEDQVVVLDAPLLIETGLEDIVDILIVVFTDYETQLKRAASRGISEQEAKNIIAMQMPLAEKVKFADFIIDNSSEDTKMTKEGVDKIWQKVQTTQKS
jgi:dephospho-CoA kinase